MRDQGSPSGNFRTAVMDFASGIRTRTVAATEKPEPSGRPVLQIQQTCQKPVGAGLPHECHLHPGRGIQFERLNGPATNRLIKPATSRRLTT